MAIDAFHGELGLLEHLPSGSLVIIKDTLQASGSFLVHHLISRLLAKNSSGQRSGVAVQAKSPSSDGIVERGDAPRQLCLIGFNDTFPHFVNVGRKLGGNLVAAAEEGRLRFVDGVSKPFTFKNGGGLLSKPDLGPVSKPPVQHTLPQKESLGASQGAVQGRLREGLKEDLQEGLANLSLSSPIDAVPDNNRSSYTMPSRNHPASSNKHKSLSSPTTHQQFTSNEAPSARVWTCQMPSLTISSKQSPLQSLYQEIARSVGHTNEQESNILERNGLANNGQEKSGQPSDVSLAVVFDDLGGVEAACHGASKDVLALLNKCRRLRGLTGERASVVALIHDDQGADGEKGLVGILEHAADLVLQVDPLSTGAAADIHGLLTVIRRRDRVRKRLSGETTTGRSAARMAEERFQFRLLETGVILKQIDGSKPG